MRSRTAAWVTALAFFIVDQVTKWIVIGPLRLQERYQIELLPIFNLTWTENRGISLGLPAWVERLSWKKFAKAFHRDPRTQRLRGWNVRIEQGALQRARPRGGGS